MKKYSIKKRGQIVDEIRQMAQECGELGWHEMAKDLKSGISKRDKAALHCAQLDAKESGMDESELLEKYQTVFHNMCCDETITKFIALSSKQRLDYIAEGMI